MTSASFLDQKHLSQITRRFCALLLPDESVEKEIDSDEDSDVVEHDNWSDLYYTYLPYLAEVGKIVSEAVRKDESLEHPFFLHYMFYGGDDTINAMIEVKEGKLSLSVYHEKDNGTVRILDTYFLDGHETITEDTFMHLALFLDLDVFLRILNRNTLDSHVTDRFDGLPVDIEHTDPVISDQYYLFYIEGKYYAIDIHPQDEIYHIPMIVQESKQWKEYLIQFDYFMKKAKIETISVEELEASYAPMKKNKINYRYVEDIDTYLTHAENE